VLWCCSSQSTLANDAQSLADLIGNAYRYDAEYLSTMQTLRADQLIYEQAMAIFLPQVDLSASYSENNYTQQDLQREPPAQAALDNGTASPAGVYSYTQDRNEREREASINLSQIIYDAEAFGRLSQADHFVQVAALEMGAAGQSLISRVAEHYFATLSSYQAVVLAEQQIKIGSESLKLGWARHLAGDISEVEAMDMEARILSLKADLNNSKTEFRNNVRQLQLSTGRRPAALQSISFAGISRLELEQFDVGTSLSNALTGNPELVLSRSGIDTAELSLSISEAARLPKVNFEASVDWAWQDDMGNSRTGNDDYLRERDAQASMTVSMPLYRGGAMSSRVRESEMRVGVAETDYVATKRRVESDVRYTVDTLNSLSGRIRDLQKTAGYLDEILVKQQQAFDEGVLGTQEILDAQDRAFQAKNELVVAVYDYYRANVQLLALEGRLDLNLVDTGKFLLGDQIYLTSR